MPNPLSPSEGSFEERKDRGSSVAAPGSFLPPPQPRQDRCSSSADLLVRSRGSRLKIHRSGRAPGPRPGHSPAVLGAELPSAPLSCSRGRGRGGQRRGRSLRASRSASGRGGGGGAAGPAELVWGNRSVSPVTVLNTVDPTPSAGFPRCVPGCSRACVLLGAHLGV